MTANGERFASAATLPAAWLVQDGVRAAARSDRSGIEPAGSPLAVVRPSTVAEVQEAVRVAAERGLPLVTRGAGSGLAGGASAGEGEVVIDLSQLNAIIAIDGVEGTARVEAGVITADLDRAAAAHGLFYAPDPGSVEISTIGGNIATNAGGLRGAKYGVTRDAVLSLDVVLADGSIVTVGRDTIKGVAGYDLAGLFVGSEGTLGIIVRATLRLLPKPPVVATALAAFGSVEDAARAVEAIAASGTRPVVLELLDEATIAQIDAAEGTSFSALGGALLIAQTDGFGADAELQQLVGSIAGIATSVETTTDPATAATLLFARRRALPALERLGRLLIEDIAVPRRRLAEAVRDIHAIGRQTGARIFVFGHAGDGNLHPVIVADSPGADAAAAAIFQLAVRLGGTLTAEHGIGLLKREWLSLEQSPRLRELQDAVRAAIDPHGIFNPGKAV